MDKINKLILVLLSFTVLQSGLALAGEQGHYFPGVMNIRDAGMPPKGVYLSVYNFHYDADHLNLASGDELDQISVSGTLNRSLNAGGHSVPLTFTGTLNGDVDLNFESTMHAPTLIWITEHKLLGADYGVMIGQPFGYMKLKAKADLTGTGTLTIGEKTHTITTSRQIEVEDDKYALADLMVTPIWLGWHGPQYDAGVNYTFYAPTGDYDKNDLVNTGMGFWTHQWQAQFIYYPPIIMPKATALSFMATYELHGEKKDKDVTPGQNITIEYGLGQYVSKRMELGVFGYNQWQITDDDGTEATSGDTHDQTNGAGVQVSYWFVEHKFCVTGRFNMEYQVEDRFEGWNAAANAVYIF